MKMKYSQLVGSSATRERLQRRLSSGNVSLPTVDNPHKASVAVQGTRDAEGRKQRAERIRQALRQSFMGRKERAAQANETADAAKKLGTVEERYRTPVASVEEINKAARKVLGVKSEAQTSHNKRYRDIRTAFGMSAG